MKSKNPNAFWLRWLGISSLHGLLFTAFWLGNPDFFIHWYSFAPVTLISGLFLSSLQYWALPQIMRPGAKRWFSASVIGQLIATTLHTSLFYLAIESTALLYLSALFLPLAIAQSWALSERFKNAWYFGLAMMIPVLLYLLPRPSYNENILLFIFEIIFWTLRGVSLGASLAFLQKYHLKETSSLKTAHERLTIQEEEAVAPDETIALAQQRMS